MNKIEKMGLSGNKAVLPDVVCYNAVINAYGWSDFKGKSSKCFALLQRMVELSQSGKNISAKPDVITCNSILNACIYDPVDTESEKEEIMDRVVETLEVFQKEVPKYGFPDHASFSQVLLAMAELMPAGEKRFEMAEATFWQCCKAGHVSVLVISALEKALPYDRFAAVMGSALKSKEGETTAYDMSSFPRSWTRYAPKKKSANKSQASRMRDRGFQVTKSTLTGKRKSLEQKQPTRQSPGSK